MAYLRFDNCSLAFRTKLLSVSQSLIKIHTQKKIKSKSSKQNPCNSYFLPAKINPSNPSNRPREAAPASDHDERQRAHQNVRPGAVPADRFDGAPAAAAASASPPPRWPSRSVVVVHWTVRGWWWWWGQRGRRRCNRWRWPTGRRQPVQLRLKVADNLEHLPACLELRNTNIQSWLLH